MKLSIQRETLLRPLQVVSSVVERRQTLPVLSNVLINCRNNTLTLTGTDLEVEMIAKASLDQEADEGETTLPARKILDICRALPEEAIISLATNGDKAIIRSGRSRFTLSCLPASDFPNIEPIASPYEFSIPQRALKELIEQTQFSMAQQDVRYYLNGLMLEITNNILKAVATDGHRLAISETQADIEASDNRQIIIPRKGVIELARLLEDSETQIRIQVGENHIKVDFPDISFTSKLIDGKFPDYQQVIPSSPTKELTCERQALYQAFARASVLSNEKYRGMRLQLSDNLLKATVHNPEQEEAEEEIEVQYKGEEFEIGFNVSYFIDALAAIKTDAVQVHFIDANHSCLVNGVEDTASKYVIMPMRL
ncbi:MAG: DNA polymerase III subunit beta [Halobacteria archaeon]|nr:DNA polymerase III subunit beta [Halobacteria archaeon]